MTTLQSAATAAVTVPGYVRGEVLLTIDHVTVQYGERVILRDVCADIQDIVRPAEHDATGQIVCFLGPSGIGKSQLCRVVAGLQQPTHGRVLVCTGPADHLVVQATAPGLVGMVPQNYALFRFATVQENLMIAGKQAGLPVDMVRAKASSLMSDLDIARYADFYPRALSGGTKQRVAIARQLMCAGRFIVMDEPFSGLDPLMKRKASELIRKVANLDERNTIIVVTHDIVEGCSIADTVWMLGRQAGQPGASLLPPYDLAERGLAWRDDPSQDRDFQDFIAEVKDRFKTLDLSA